MNLVESIINDLTDSSKSLNEALLKTKVLATRIKNDDLLKWVNFELSGYKNNRDELPDYRHAKATFLCTIQQGWNQQSNVPLPLMLFPQEFRDRFLTFDVDDSIHLLEEHSKDPAGSIYKDFPPDMCAWLTGQMLDRDKHHMRILELRLIVQVGQFIQALAVVRSRLLELVLKVEAEFPNLDELIKKQLVMQEDFKEKMDNIVHQTIINAGDGNTITAGNKNTITTNYKLIKGDKQALKDELKKLKVQDEDIAEIVEIVGEEQPDMNTGKFGTKTNTWLGKMYQKALDGTWDVGVAAAGGLLVEVLKGFFGL